MRRIFQLRSLPIILLILVNTAPSNEAIRRMSEAEKIDDESFDRPQGLSKVVVPNAPYTPIGINFYGGDIIDSGVNVYIYWYGSWSSASKSAVKNFIYAMGHDSGLPGSVKGWWQVTLQYYNKLGEYIDPAVELVHEFSNTNYSIGNQLTLWDGSTLALKSIMADELPADPTGVYLILLSSDSVVRMNGKKVNLQSYFF